MQVPVVITPHKTSSSPVAQVRSIHHPYIARFICFVYSKLSLSLVYPFVARTLNAHFFQSVHWEEYVPYRTFPYKINQSSNTNRRTTNQILLNSDITIVFYVKFGFCWCKVIFAKESNRNKLCVHSKNGSTLDGFTRRL